MVATLLVLSSIAWADVSASPRAVRQQVETLLIELDAAAGNSARRDQIEKQILKIGPPVLDVLPSLLADRKFVRRLRNFSHVKDRANRLQKQLERQFAQSIVQSSRITYKTSGSTLHDVLAEFERQTGNKIFDARLPGARTDHKLQLDIQDVSFWDALAAVMRLAKLEIDPFASDTKGQPINGIALVARTGPIRKHVFFSGPIRFEVTDVRARRDLGDPSRSQLKATLLITWEPRLNLIEIRLPVVGLKATGSDRKPLEFVGRKALLSAAIGSSVRGIQLEIPMKLPPRDSKTISKLSGTLQILVPGPTASLRFDNPTRRGVRRTRGDVEVLLDEVSVQDGLHHFGLKVFFKQPSGAVQSHYDWIYANQAYLLDTDGKVVKPERFSSDGVAENQIRSDYFFKIKGDVKDYALVYRTPMALMSFPVLFEFRNLPLP